MALLNPWNENIHINYPFHCFSPWGYCYFPYVVWEVFWSRLISSGILDDRKKNSLGFGKRDLICRLKSLLQKELAQIKKGKHG